MLSYQENKEWLHKLMDLLEAHFGPDVEFVLHDLTLDYEHTIVDIRNGHITGREIGGTGDILGLEYIRNASEDNGTRARPCARPPCFCGMKTATPPCASPSTRTSPKVWSWNAISTATTGSTPSSRTRTSTAATSMICCSI